MLGHHEGRQCRSVWNHHGDDEQEIFISQFKPLKLAIVNEIQTLT